jgi:hypothetical protein
MQVQNKMKKNKIVIGVTLILGGIWLVKKLLNNKVTVERIKLGEERECPLNIYRNEEELGKRSDEKTKWLSNCKKNNPLAGLTFGFPSNGMNESCATKYYKYMARPDSWKELDCTEEEIKEHEDWIKNGMKGFNIGQGIFGENSWTSKPFLKPSQMINMAKLTDNLIVGKDYNKFCGTKECWIFDDITQQWNKEA